jgi:predicted dehydrogenase
MSTNRTTTRREFINRTAVFGAGALAAPYFATAARAAAAAASDRLVFGSIGVGGQGRGIMHAAKRFGDIAVVCDVDAAHGRQARQEAGEKTELVEDYRRILDRKDIQAVTIGTPDHWHTKIAIEALQSGKDVYCEKPLTLTIDEGKKICQAVKQTGRVFQVGTQQRTDGPFLQAIALIRAGRLGKVKRVSCAIGGADVSGPIPVVDPPKELNWERWLGQAPLVELRQQGPGKNAEGVDVPYASRCHSTFRWWYEYSGGKVTDWGAHHIDIATWALGLDKTGPSSVHVESSKHPVPFKNGYPTLDDRYNTANEFNVVAQFPEVEMVIRHDTDNGILFEGDKGRIFVSRGALNGKPVEELAENPLPEDAIRQVYKGKNPHGHMANFVECVKSREEPISDVFSHHRALSTGHLANIALRLDREVKWDPVKEEVIGDDEAQSFVSREQRKGYEIVL